jgi:hypothetical protein
MDQSTSTYAFVAISASLSANKISSEAKSTAFFRLLFCFSELSVTWRAYSVKL